MQSAVTAISRDVCEKEIDPVRMIRLTFVRIGNVRPLFTRPNIAFQYVTSKTVLPSPCNPLLLMPPLAAPLMPQHPYPLAVFRR
jgi:hypothetical protein